MVHIVLSANTSWYLKNFRTNLIRFLLLDGHKITVVCPFEEFSTDRKFFMDLGADVENLHMSSKGKNPFSDLQTFRHFISIYRRIKPDICLYWTIKSNIWGSLASKFLNIPTINNISGLGTAFSKQSRVSNVVTPLYRNALKNSKHIFFQNIEDKTLFQNLKIVHEESISVLPGSGVDLQFFNFHELPDNPFTFLFTGRLLKEKGAGITIEAMEILKKEYPDIRLILLGPYDPKDKYMIDEEQIIMAKYNNIAEFPGLVNDVKPWLTQAHCVVLPSWYREGIPRSLLEATAFGRPIIAADSIGTREPVIDGVNGFLCKPQDVHSLVVCMKKMLACTQKELKTMGKESRKLAETRFDESIVLNAYKRVIAKQHKGTSKSQQGF